MASPNRVIVTGATGLIGRVVSSAVTARGDSLVVFSRDPATVESRVPGASAYIAWQPDDSDSWTQQVSGAYGIVHLAGAPIFSGTRQTQESIRAETQRRVQSIRQLVLAMAAAPIRPQVFVSAS